MELVADYTTLRELAIGSVSYMFQALWKNLPTYYTSAGRAVEPKLEQQLLSTFGCCIFNVSANYPPNFEASLP
jgi:hypothetical protein